MGGNRGLSEKRKKDLKEVAIEFHTMAEILEKLANGEIITRDAMIQLEPESKDSYGSGSYAGEWLVRRMDDRFFRLTSTAFKKHKFTEEEFNALFCETDSPTTKFVRDVLDIPESIYIEQATIDEHKLWKVVEENVGERNAYIIKRKYGVVVPEGLSENFSKTTLRISVDVDLCEGRVNQIIQCAIRGVGNRIRRERSYRRKFAEALFGVNPMTLQREAYTIVDFMRSIRLQEEFDTTLEDPVKEDPIATESTEEEPKQETDVNTNLDGIETDSYEIVEEETVDELEHINRLSNSLSSRFSIATKTIKNGNEEIVLYITDTAKFHKMISAFRDYSNILEKVAYEYNVDVYFLEQVLILLEQALPVFYKINVEKRVPADKTINYGFRYVDSPSLKKHFEQIIKLYPDIKLDTHDIRHVSESCIYTKPIEYIGIINGDVMRLPLTAKLVKSLQDPFIILRTYGSRITLFSQEDKVASLLTIKAAYDRMMLSEKVGTADAKM